MTINKAFKEVYSRFLAEQGYQYCTKLQRFKDLADVAGYSEYYFIRLFQREMNVKPMDYVRRRRLIKASEAIISGKKIIDVAFEYGWQSHSGFTKSFTKEFGFQPSLLRAMVIELKHLGGSAMNHVFLEATEIGMNKEELLKILQKKLNERGSVENSTLNQMYKLACGAYEGVCRYSGEEYVTHTLNVAIILTELEAKAEVILAGMFCDVAKKGVISMEDLRKKMPKEVYEIVLQAQGKENQCSFVADDVVLMKLAERLHNMRTIDFMDENKKQEKARETIEIFMPLARRLDNKKLIDELNDLSLKYS